jgi:hypothetical protein
MSQSLFVKGKEHLRTFFESQNGTMRQASGRLAIVIKLLGGTWGTALVARCSRQPAGKDGNLHTLPPELCVQYYQASLM